MKILDFIQENPHKEEENSLSFCPAPQFLGAGRLEFPLPSLYFFEPVESPALAPRHLSDAVR
jgi:hypothetical protein